MKPGATPNRVPGRLRRLCLGIAAVLVLFSLMPAAANAVEEVGDDTNAVDGSLRMTRVDLGVRNQSAEVPGVPGASAD